MNTKTDLIGARVCGFMETIEEPWPEKTLITGRKGLGGRRAFSISNKADRMDVVEALAKRHGIGICGDGKGRCFLWYENEQKHVGDYADSEEATRAALEPLANVYLKEGEG